MLSRMKIVSMVAMNARMAYPANALARILSKGVESYCILPTLDSGLLIVSGVENRSCLGLDENVSDGLPESSIYSGSTLIFYSKFCANVRIKYDVYTKDVEILSASCAVVCLKHRFLLSLLKVPRVSFFLKGRS